MIADEKPLDILVEGYSHTSVFRTIAIVGDSLSSGEFESVDTNGNRNYHDMYEYSWGQFIARTCGSTVYNFSRGGMSAKWYMRTFADEKDFWNKVVNVIRPDIGASDAAKKLLDNIYTGGIDEQLILPEEAIEYGFCDEIMEDFV